MFLFLVYRLNSPQRNFHQILNWHGLSLPINDTFASNKVVWRCDLWSLSLAIYCDNYALRVTTSPPRLWMLWRVVFLPSRRRQSWRPRWLAEGATASLCALTCDRWLSGPWHAGDADSILTRSIAKQPWALWRLCATVCSGQLCILCSARTQWAIRSLIWSTL